MGEKEDGETEIVLNGMIARLLHILSIIQEFRWATPLHKVKMTTEQLKNMEDGRVSPVTY